MTKEEKAPHLIPEGTYGKDIKNIKMKLIVFLNNFKMSEKATTSLLSQ